MTLNYHQSPATKPAVAAGNAVVAKPSRNAVLRLPAGAGESAHLSAFPRAPSTSLQGFGGQSAGQAVINHPDIDAVTFTGASATRVLTS